MKIPDEYKEYIKEKLSQHCSHLTLGCCDTVICKIPQYAIDDESDIHPAIDEARTCPYLNRNELDFYYIGQKVIFCYGCEKVKIRDKRTK